MTENREYYYAYDIESVISVLNRIADRLNQLEGLSGDSKQGIFVNNSNGNPNISDIIFDIDASVAEGAWESVGPRDSNADNVWKALDAVPSGVSYVELKFHISCSSIVGGGAENAQIYVRKSGGSGSGAYTLVAQAADYSDGGDTRGDGLVVLKVPVNSSVLFDVFYNSSFTTDNLRIILMGYGYN